VDPLDVLTRPGPQAAPLLLGWRLSHATAEGVVSVALTEVEAYAGLDDPASHAFRGPTPRTAIMFGPAGRLYVYFVYGMHWCANVVTGPDGEASAVLLRAGRVVEGVELARRRRGPRVPEVGLARGPAGLTRALGVAAGQNGADLLDSGAVRLTPGPQPAAVQQGPRVGVTRAVEVPWRFSVAADPTVSPYRRSPKAPPLSPVAPRP